MSIDMEPSTPGISADLPLAGIKPPKQKHSFAWVMPFISLALVIYLGYQQWSQTGTSILIRFEEGHGIKKGDTLRYRGINIGEIRSIGLNQQLDKVEITIHIQKEAQHLTREGSLFWIVRPSLKFSGVQGLDTLVGSHYISVVPGKGKEKRIFTGLETPPLANAENSNSLEVLLEAKNTNSIVVGSLVTYHHFPIGQVVSTYLSSDARSIGVRIHIDRAYTSLIRENSEFFHHKGFSVNASLLDGFSFSFDSLQTLLTGSIGVATPNVPGKEVVNGHSFKLLDTGKEEHNSWNPSLPVGISSLPSHINVPSLVKAKLVHPKTFHKSQHTESWFLPVKMGFIGPATMFPVSDLGIFTPKTSIHVAGQALSLDTQPAWQHDHLILWPSNLPESVIPWDESRIKPFIRPEHCFLVWDNSLLPIAIDASRFYQADTKWFIDEILPISPDWHGACLISREDGHIMGMTIYNDGRARVVSFPES